MRSGTREHANMTKVTYEIVEHDEGWAYKVGDVFSERFETREEAERAAAIAAAEQELAGQDQHIEYADEEGRWHEENAPGDDRPETEVRG
jgi:hypothetical protein